MCNSCDCFSSITFPNFVGQSCCNPCCPDSGSVGGTSDSKRRCCFCFDCDMCESGGGVVGGVTDNNGGSNSCGCNDTPLPCGCQNHNHNHNNGCSCSNGNWMPCCGAR